MHLVHVISTDLAGTVRLGDVSMTVRAFVMSLVTIAFVTVALVLPFPHGDGAIRPVDGRHGGETAVPRRARPAHGAD